MNNKLINLRQYSDPKQVIQNVKEYLGNDIQLFMSTRNNKKYMIQHPQTNKWIHFGQMGMEDFTKHKDKKRQDNFKKRNAKWSKQDKYTPGWLSYYLLW